MFADVSLTLTAVEDSYTVSTIDGSADVTIDDSVPLVAVYASPAWTAADRSPGEFSIKLSEAASTDVTVAYGVGGTAIAGTDYTAPVGHVVIPVGETTAQVEIDALPGGSGTVTLQPMTVTFSDGAFYCGSYYGGSATLTIADDRPEMTVSDAVCNEGDAKPSRFCSRTPISSTASVSVPYTLVDGSAVLGTDYTDPSGGTTATGTLTLPPGATEVDLVIPTLLDAANTAGQTFGLDLGDIAQANIVRSQARERFAASQAALRSSIRTAAAATLRSTRTTAVPMEVKLTSPAAVDGYFGLNYDSAYFKITTDAAGDNVIQSGVAVIARASGGTLLYLRGVATTDDANPANITLFYDAPTGSKSLPKLDQKQENVTEPTVAVCVDLPGYNSIPTLVRNAGLSEADWETIAASRAAAVATMWRAARDACGHVVGRRNDGDGRLCCRRPTGAHPRHPGRRRSEHHGQRPQYDSLRLQGRFVASHCSE